MKVVTEEPSDIDEKSKFFLIPNGGMHRRIRNFSESQRASIAFPFMEAAIFWILNLLIYFQFSRDL